MRKLILALVLVVSVGGRAGTVYCGDNYGELPSHAVLLGQVLGALEACQKADPESIMVITDAASSLLSTNKEKNMLVLYGFASGAFHQGRHQIQGTSEISCDQAESLVKSLKQK